ncbi:MAG: hypothetical protein ACFFDI_25090, partial [Promethearchaeota archaeon]
MNKTQIDEAVKKAIETGNWMIRTENKGGISPSSDAKGFKWKPIGKWTIAPDWLPTQNCGHGLHGQAPEAGGYNAGGKYIVFCETRGNRVIIGDDKIKVEKARRLLVGKLPDGLIFKSSLALSGCDLKGITLPQRVGG